MTCPPTAVEEFRNNPPTTRAGWVALAQRILADLSDARADLAEAKSNARAQRKYLPRREFEELQDEVDELKITHQACLMSASALPRLAPLKPATAIDADERFLTALKEEAKSMLTGTQYAALIAGTNRRVSEGA